MLATVKRQGKQQKGDVAGLRTLFRKREDDMIYEKACWKDHCVHLSPENFLTIFPLLGCHLYLEAGEAD